MKKVLFTVALLLATSLTAIADDTKGNTNVGVYDIEFNINSLARYLELSEEQILDFDYVQKAFSDGLKCAGEINDSERRNNMVKSAIEYDLRNLRNILTREQYKKYLKVLNLTFINRGINR